MVKARLEVYGKNARFKVVEDKSDYKVLEVVFDDKDDEAQDLTLFVERGSDVHKIEIDPKEDSRTWIGSGMDAYHVMFVEGYETLARRIKRRSKSSVSA